MSIHISLKNGQLGRRLRCNPSESAAFDAEITGEDLLYICDHWIVQDGFVRVHVIEDSSRSGWIRANHLQVQQGFQTWKVLTDTSFYPVRWFIDVKHLFIQVKHAKAVRQDEMD